MFFGYAGTAAQTASKTTKMAEVSGSLGRTVSMALEHPSSVFWTRIGQTFLSRHYEGFAYCVLANLSSQLPCVSPVRVGQRSVINWDRGSLLPSGWLATFEANSTRRSFDVHHLWRRMRVLPGAELSRYEKRSFHNKTPLNAIICRYIGFLKSINLQYI